MALTLGAIRTAPSTTYNLWDIDGDGKRETVTVYTSTYHSECSDKVKDNDRLPCIKKWKLELSSGIGFSDLKSARNQIGHLITLQEAVIDAFSVDLAISGGNLVFSLRYSAIPPGDIMGPIPVKDIDDLLSLDNLSQ